MSLDYTNYKASQFATNKPARTDYDVLYTYGLDLAHNIITAFAEASSNFEQVGTIEYPINNDNAKLYLTFQLHNTACNYYIRFWLLVPTAGSYNYPPASSYREYFHGIVYGKTTPTPSTVYNTSYKSCNINLYSGNTLKYYYNYNQINDYYIMGTRCPCWYAVSKTSIDVLDLGLDLNLAFPVMPIFPHNDAWHSSSPSETRFLAGYYSQNATAPATFWQTTHDTRFTITSDGKMFMIIGYLSSQYHYISLFSPQAFGNDMTDERNWCWHSSMASDWNDSKFMFVDVSKSFNLVGCDPQYSRYAGFTPSAIATNLPTVPVICHFTPYNQSSCYMDFNGNGNPIKGTFDSDLIRGASTTILGKNSAFGVTYNSGRWLNLSCDSNKTGLLYAWKPTFPSITGI